MRENADQNNSEYRHFLRSDNLVLPDFFAVLILLLIMSGRWPNCSNFWLLQKAKIENQIRSIFPLLSPNISLKWTKTFCPTDKITWIQRQSPKVFCKKVFLKISQNSRENTCARVYFLIKLKTCTFSYRTPPVAASFQ